MDRASWEHEAEQGGVDGGLYAIAIALMDVAYQLRCLGNGGAATQMGAIEHLAVQVKEGSERMADAIEALRVEP